MQIAKVIEVDLELLVRRQEILANYRGEALGPCNSGTPETRMTSHNSIASSYMTRVLRLMRLELRERHLDGLKSGL